MTYGVNDNIMAGAAPDEGAEQREEDHVSVGDSVSRLVSSGKEFVQAELALARTRTTLVAGAAQRIAILGVLAVIVAFGMIVTLMIGAVLALAPVIGLGFSLLAVTGAALVVLAICGLGIKGQVARIGSFLK
ncbi:MAG: phage holin family protein [Sphingobium sp.]